MEDAYFEEAGTWNFQTGFLTYYTSDMPLVRNEKWKKRTMLIIPLYFKYYPTDFLKLEFDITDLFIEFPYIDHRNMGGKSPRFLAKMRILEERNYLPAIAFTIESNFQAPNLHNMGNDHNYDESNGLQARPGSRIIFVVYSFQNLGKFGFLTTRLGLAPLDGGIYAALPRQTIHMDYHTKTVEQVVRVEKAECIRLFNRARPFVARQAVRLFKSGSSEF